MRNEIRFAVLSTRAHVHNRVRCTNRPTGTCRRGARDGYAGRWNCRRARVNSWRRDARSAAPAKEPVITTMPMDVPSGTDLVLTLETAVSSETAKADQPVRAKVAKPVVVAGMEVIPAGATVTGAVVSAERSGRVKGRASVALRFNEVIVMNTPYRITTERISRLADATKGEDATKIGIARVSARRSARSRAAKKARRSAPVSAAAPARVRCSRRAAKK